jgi:hypothetical protein
MGSCTSSPTKILEEVVVNPHTAQDRLHLPNVLELLVLPGNKAMEAI